MSDERTNRKVRFMTQEIAQAFIDKFVGGDKDLFIPAPFGKDANTAEYWGIAIVATNRGEELEGYRKFIDNCRRMAIRPRFVFLNRIDSKLIKDDKIEEIGVPWMSPADAAEQPIDILDPIDDGDINTDEAGPLNEPNIDGEDFEPPKEENVNILGDLVMEDKWVSDYIHSTGQTLHEDVIPIDAVRLSQSGTPDARFSSVRKMIKNRNTVKNIKFIDISVGDSDQFIYAFQSYADSKGLNDGSDYIIVKDDYIVMTSSKLTSDVLDLMEQYGVSLYNKSEDEMQDDTYDEIDEVSDIPDIM